MCIIIAQDPGSPILSESRLRNAWEANPDGAGFMFATGESVVIRKPYFRLESFVDQYRADFDRFGMQSPFVLHFRITTHGAEDKKNTHPHRLAADCALVHNGVLSFGETSEKKSDTVAFCRSVLAHRSTDQLVDPAFGEWIGGLIGSFNKLAILAGDGRLSIVNHAQGSEIEPGLWASNRSLLTGRFYCFDEGFDPYDLDYWNSERFLPKDCTRDERDRFLFEAKANPIENRRRRKRKHRRKRNRWSELKAMLGDDAEERAGEA